MCHRGLFFQFVFSLGPDVVLCIKASATLSLEVVSVAASVSTVRVAPSSLPRQTHCHFCVPR